MTDPRKLLLPLALTLTVAACSRAPSPSADVAGTAAASAPSAAVVTSGDADGTGMVDLQRVASGHYTLDTGHTNVLVQWKHYSYSRPSAGIAGITGTLDYDALNPRNSRVDVTIPIEGITAFFPPLTDHLLSSDFFEEATYKTATFKSTQVTPSGVNKLQVVGNLTIKDITHPVRLDVTFVGSGISEFERVPVIGFTAITRIPRSEFGLGLYVPNISDMVELRISAEALLRE